MIQIVGLLLAALFFGAMGVVQLLRDPIAAPPQFFWSGLFVWLAWTVIAQQRRIEKAHKEFMRSHKL
jgi:hypothetical protein